MMKKALLVTVACFGLAPGVWAAHRDDERRGDYRRVERIAVLAHRVEDAAEHVNQAARRDQHHFTWWEYRALRKLDRLEEEARHFHRQVESYRQDPSHTLADFEDLVRAYQAAARSIDDLHAYEHVEDDFRRLSDLMDRLVNAYTYYGYRGHGYRGHGFGR